MKKFIVGIILILLSILIISVYYPKLFIPKNSDIGTLNNMKIKSIFQNNGRIPEKYTCDGEDISPPLEISDVPANARTIAVIVDDPDAPAGDWVHWLVWNISASSEIKIAEGEKPEAIQGINDFRKLNYGGPCPPSGTHRYFFKVYALDSVLSLKEGSSKKQLEDAMKGHIINKAELIGLYSRKS